MREKCPECKSCLDTVYLKTGKMFHCWFCNIFYNKIDNELVIVTPDNINPQVLKQIQESK